MATAPVNANLARAFAPPVMEARRWVAEAALPADLPLLNVSQAAPVDPPPESLRTAMAVALEQPETHLYGPVLGDAALRETIAEHWSRLHGGTVTPEQVAVTAGCNQAFCAAVATLAAPGDAVMLPVPWYFNHKMWLDMAGVECIPLPCGEGMLPDPEAARAALTDRTRAITLISPNNPTGAEYPDALLHAFMDLCAERGLALILDETYRDFHSGSGAPHTLFSRADWAETLVHLYSFSKVFRLTGHRTGALVTGAARLAEAEKFLDTVTICPPRIGQVAALHGLRTLSQWVAEERGEILSRGAALSEIFADLLPEWRIVSSGAYFAWVEPPHDIPSDTLARRLVSECGVLMLPGTMFMLEGGGREALRLAFANADRRGLADLATRLSRFAP